MITFQDDATGLDTGFNLRPEYRDDDEKKEKSKIPFLFAANPFRLVDDGMIAELDGNTVKVLNVICRYIDLGEQLLVGERYLT